MDIRVNDKKNKIKYLWFMILNRVKFIIKKCVKRNTYYFKLFEIFG